MTTLHEILTEHLTGAGGPEQHYDIHDGNREEIVNDLAVGIIDLYEGLQAKWSAECKTMAQRITDLQAERDRLRSLALAMKLVAESAELVERA